MMKPGRTKTWIGLMFLNGQGCVGINLEFFSASSGVGLRIHSLVSETRLGQVRSQPDQRVLKFFQTWWDPIQKLSCKTSRMTCLSFVFPSKPPRRTSLKINSEMTWLSFSFHYKRLNLYFTIKLVFEIRTSHYIHALAFHAKQPTSQVTLPPVVQACLQRTEVGWQYGQIRINILTAKVLTSNINVPVFILMKIS